MNKNKNNKLNPIFVNFEYGAPVSNLITKFKVKILYEGVNRNGTEFKKEVIENFAKTLPATPVVGIYSGEKQDFLSHMNFTTVETQDGMDYEIQYPVPYGFVPESATSWYERSTDYDGVEREYLCTDVYLWTGRYPELDRLKMGKNNQSMELNPRTIEGNYVMIEGKEVFSFSKAEALGLCILGEEVEPCFEGAAFNYANNEEAFVTLLSKMRYELQQLEEAEEAVEEVEEIVEDIAEEVEVEEEVIEVEEVEEEIIEEPVEEEVIEEVEEVEEEVNFEAPPLDENSIEELEEENIADEIDLLAEIEQIKNLLVERNSAYEALEKELNETKEKLNSYSSKIEKIDKIEKLNGDAEKITKENFDHISSMIDAISIEELAGMIEKFEALNKYAEDITPENYATLTENMSKLTVAEIVSQARDFAYENLKSIVKQGAQKKEEPKQEEDEESNQYTFSLEPEETSVFKEEWMQVVARRQKTK